MFKKKPNVKPRAPLRSSDHRKMAQQIVLSFSYTATPITATGSSPSTPEEQASSDATLRNLLLPDGTSAAKFNTTHGPDLSPVNGTIYFGSHCTNDSVDDDHAERPLWVRVDHAHPKLFPTVYTLWKNPTLLPMLYTHKPVVERLYDGANLMIPGLIGPPFPEGARVGALVAVANIERPTVPVVVGVCEVDVAGLRKTVGEKGRAVRVLHWAGDGIYNYGPGNAPSIPKELEAVGQYEEAEGVAANVANRVQELEITEEKKDAGSGGEIRTLETKEIDDAFYSAVLYGLHDHSKKYKSLSLEFPLSASAFISIIVRPYLPPASYFPPHNNLQNHGPHPSLHLKKTSWKNSAKFLKHLQSKTLLVIKVRNGGETVVQDINLANREVLSFTPYRLPEAHADGSK